MKTQRIALATVSLLSIFLIAPVAAQPPVTVISTWQGFTYHGFDPYYGAVITGFKAGSTGTLTLSIDNMYDTYINVTGAKLMFPDWNVNYTATATKSIPMRINQLTVLPLAFSVSIPATTVASNLVPHDYNWYINFTGPSPVGTHNFFVPPGGGGGVLYVLSSEQSDTLAAAQQLPQTVPSFGSSYSYCGVSIFGTSTGFKTAAATTLCQQSQQQANLGLSLYSAADFADAKTAFQTAANDWNQALSADKSTGGNLELGQTVQGWGFLLLGIGALVAGAAGVVYAMKRPRELRGMAAATTTH